MFPAAVYLVMQNTQIFRYFCSHDFAAFKNIKMIKIKKNRFRPQKKKTLECNLESNVVCFHLIKLIQLFFSENIPLELNKTEEILRFEISCPSVGMLCTERQYYRF